MAVATPHVQTNNTFLRAIEGNVVWRGPITYNVVQIANATELNAYNAAQAASGDPAMTRELPAAWVAEIQQAFDLFMEIIDADLAFSNLITADYLVGEDPSTSLGFATTPATEQGTMGFNLDNEAHTTEPETGGGHDRFQTFIHEIGHSLGLAHPHDTGGNTTAPSTNEANMPIPFQSQYTMMSCTPAPNTDGFFAFGRSITP
ncbi:MAG TPA: matrixin family metalloprotease, partial [Rhizobiaceae bacterium]|nr:matrixin family metalloprotease [Rhizobiaceae bacterium]